MELANFFKLLYRHRFVLIAVPIIALVFTYFLTHNLSDNYVSETDLATGIIDPNQQILNNTDGGIQESKVNQQFSNLLGTIRLGKVIDQVSYQLILHDLTHNQAFRPKSKQLKELNADAVAHALAVFNDKYKHRAPLDLTDQDEAGLEKVLVAQKYDAESLKKDLTIYRTDNSDFVHLEFSSDQPQLSAFVLNTLCKEFIAYTIADEQKNKGNSNSFLQKLVQEKLDTMNAKVAGLRNYKIKNHILDLKDQSTSLYTQLTDYRDRKAQAEKDILSYNSAIANINSRFNPNDRRYQEASSVKMNGQIAQTRDRLAAVNNKYIQSNFDPRYRKSSDSLQNVLDAQISQVADKYVSNPLAGKENLVQEKVKMEITRDMTRSGLNKLDNQISQLNSQLERIVPFDAVIQAYNRDIEVATKEYLDVQNRFNQSSLETNIKTPLKQVETAMPGVKQPSKKLLLTLLSGVASEVLCLVVLFALFYFDNTIRVPTDLANATQIPVLGKLNFVVKANIDFKLIGNNPQSTEEMQQFSNLLRSIRYEVDNELHVHEKGVGAEGKVLAITSLKAGEGKSLVAMGLASAFAIANKKVLVIDGNFDHPTLTKAAFEKAYFEDFLKDDNAEIQAPDNNQIYVLGNLGSDKSLLEKSSEQIIGKKIIQLKKSFDIIIIETQDLSLMNKAKEWIQFADKVIAVFEANQSIDHEKQLSLNYLRTLNNKFIGLILNKVIVTHELEAKQA